MMSQRRWRDERPTWYRDETAYLVGGAVGVAGVLGAVALLLDRFSLDLWIAMAMAVALLIGSVPVVRRITRADSDTCTRNVLLWGLAATFVFSMMRYVFIFALYGGISDSLVYHEAGATFVERLRTGTPVHPIEVMTPYPAESRRIGDAAGVIYALTGPNIYAGFFAFAYICFWGKVLIIRAFRVAVPEGDHRRFAVMVMFLPSLLFWPSSIGKEALMMGCLGVIVYGGALLLAPKPRLRGVLYFGVGALLVLLVRPHIALMSILGLGVAMVVGVLKVGEGGQVRGRAFRLAALALLVALAGLGSTRLAEQFEDYAEDGARATLESTEERSSIGGSEFVPVAVSTPLEVPLGVVSVLLRPFPWEARNLNSLMTAAESLVLLALIVASWRRIASFPKLSVRRPFLVYCLSYVLLFSIGFSFIGNFGILARQRVLVLPIVLVFLSLPKRGRAEATVGTGSTAAAQPTAAEQRPTATTLS